MRAPRRILLDHRGGVALAALVAQERRGAHRLVDVILAEAGAPRVGEIWAARIDKPAARGAGGGAFIDLGDGGRAFLPRAEDAASGDTVKVAILRGPEADKAPTATLKLEFHGRRLAHTPLAPGVNVSRRISDPAERARLIAALAGVEEAGGFVIRTAAEGADAADLRSEAEALARVAAETEAAPPKPPRRLRRAPGVLGRARRLWPDAVVEGAEEADAPRDARPLARHGLDAALEALLSARVALLGAELSGAWLACERTTALIAFDVNLGAARSAEAANLAALKEIPRQLRMRGWGGQIVIDLAAIDRGARTEAVSARARYQEALASAADSALDVVGFGPLGLLEARRRRERAPIEERLSAADLTEDAPPPPEGYGEDL